jgi:hypothetical protein
VAGGGGEEFGSGGEAVAGASSSAASLCESLKYSDSESLSSFTGVPGEEDSDSSPEAAFSELLES